jgi:dienelactone hydrolase
MISAFALAFVCGSGDADLAARYRRADELPAFVRGKALNLTLAPNWIGSQAVWYRAERQGGHEFMVATVDGKKRPLFDHARLGKALEAVSGDRLDPKRLSISELAVSVGLDEVVFSFGGKRYRVKLGDYVVQPATGGGAPEAVVAPPAEDETAHERPLPAAGWEPQGQDPAARATSPKRDWTFSIEDGKLRVRAKDATHWSDLSADTGFTTARWAPNSNTLVAFRLIPGDRRQVHLLASSRRNQTRAILESRFYDQPGDQLDRYEGYVFNVPEREEVKLDLPPIVGGGQPWTSAPQTRWWRGGFLLSYAERGYQRYYVRYVELPSGKVTTLIDESYPTFFDTTSVAMSPLQCGELLWRSERDGWGHLYLVDGETGAVKRQVTRGSWVVRAIVDVDETKRTVLFMANGREPGDPYHQYLYRASLDREELSLVTPTAGNHRLTWSPDRTSFVDTISQINVAPVHEWRRADGSLIAVLESAEVSGLEKMGVRAPEPFVAKGRDGKTDIWGIVVRPSDYDRRKKYPVIENIYAGPHDSHVPKSYLGLTRMHRLAELGFIVVQVDGMGTRNRGKAFHDVCWQNLADAGFPDRIAWMKALAAKDPAVDLSRVGIYGTSAGGQNAAAALLFFGDFYKVGVASCGCHDNRIDKMWWNEQWMGYPVGPHYIKNSNIEQADRLKGKLLLIVGELDRNVPPESTFRFADALLRAKKEFDLVVIPGADHTDGGDYGERKRRDFFVRHLLGKASPEWNDPR